MFSCVLLERPQIWYNALDLIYVIGIVYRRFRFSDCLWRECWSTSIAHHRQTTRSHYLINGHTIIWLCNHQNATRSISLLWCKLTFRPQEIWWKPAAAWSSRTTSAGLFNNSISHKKWQIVFSVSLISSSCLVQVWCQSGSLREPSLFAVWSLLTSATNPPPASALSGSPRRRALAASTSCKYTNTHGSVFV